MKISKALFVDPAANTIYGIFAVTLSYFVFAYSEHFGKLPILVYYALWFPLVVIDHRRAIGNPTRYAWIALFAFFALASVFWSQAASVSMRASVQYFTHVVCALIVARTVSPRTFVLGSLAGIFIVVAYSLADGSYIYDPLDGTYSLVGAFSSKNQLGLFASLGVFFAFASLWIFPERWPLKIGAALVGLISAFALVKSQSATSVIAVAAVVPSLIALSVLLKFAPNSRTAFFIGALALGAGLAIVAVESGAVAMVLGAFGKDTSLTGRTYLWAQGMLASKKAPLAGVGYQAYWVQGFPDPERLWQEFYITSRTGFHFHDTYIETLLELGYLGAGLLTLTLVRTLAGHIRLLLRGEAVRTAHLMIGVGLLLLIRSFVEVDILAPYQIGSFLLYYAAGLVAKPQAVAARTPVLRTSGRSQGWASAG